MVQGHRYFRCQQGYGIFVKKGALVSELHLGTSPLVRAQQRDLEVELAATVSHCENVLQPFAIPRRAGWLTFPGLHLSQNDRLKDAEAVLEGVEEEFVKELTLTQMRCDEAEVR
jgi:hypothetical protein